MPRTSQQGWPAGREDRPGDRRVQGQVGKLVEHLVEPAAEGRAGSLEAGQTAVGGVEDQGQRQGQRCQDGGSQARAGKGHQNRRGEHEGRRGERQSIGPDAGGLERLGQPLGQAEGPEPPQRLVGQPPLQLLLGGRERVGRGRAARSRRFPGSVPAARPSEAAGRRRAGRSAGRPRPPAAVRWPARPDRAPPRPPGPAAARALPRWHGRRSADPAARPGAPARAGGPARYGPARPRSPADRAGREAGRRSPGGEPEKTFLASLRVRTLEEMRRPRATPSQRGAASPFATTEICGRTPLAALSTFPGQRPSPAAPADLAPPREGRDKPHHEVDPAPSQPVGQSQGNPA